MLEACFENLAAKLTDGDPNVRLRAARSVRLIMEWGGPNCRIPIGTRDDPDAFQFCVAALAGGYSLTGFALAVLPSLAAAKGDAHESLQVEAELALGDVAGSLIKTFAPLLLALRRGSGEAARALGSVGKALVAAGFDEAFERRVIFDALIDALCGALNLNGDLAVSVYAAEALGEIGPEAVAAVPDLIEAIRQRANGALSYHAAYTLGAMGAGASEAIPALEELSSHLDIGLSGAGRDALRMIRGERPDAKLDAPEVTGSD